MIIKKTVDEPAETEKQVEEAIAEFNQWFQQKGNEPIIMSEKAIIKTFLYFMLFERKDGS